ncbi:Trp biosynthesis-associated membrane protein [Nocardioides bizhenqiangii]|uniref:Trp biosynthesis-associated membrane protein n=1 Tax=Nocardioides bizhenqiangii TaxID=3095076 RepID=A0ABZ0ZKW5_9ACTN|nr:MULTISPECIES: Trp biosynthesis-associated membrane protein [unclassified Nocardioides]MDZ5620602.1 Trp biosynthesis-associated membrane protein [Nocardioides sp. HM23]WQQ24972.1 Trp biosynthesis-associated membrane protein [Nocardioides sp. HM61]
MTGRRAFWPVVLVGIAASGLSALAGHRPLMQVQEARLEQLGAGAIAQSEHIKELPLAGAFALVMLACWGVVLVTGGLLRRIVAALAAASAAALVLTLVVEGLVKSDEVVVELGAPIEYTGWFWLAMAASVVALVAAVAAVWWSPEWPEMGSRYDAPASHEAQPSDAPPEERTSLDLWKSMDEGDDPTDHDRTTGP